MVRLTDHPDMTLDVYRGRKTTTQFQQQLCNLYSKDALLRDKLTSCFKSQTCIVALIQDNHFLVVVVDLLFYVHGKHLRSCRDGQLT